MSRPRVLLTNDDGIDSPGIASLYEALKDDYDVLPVAPHRQQSGVSHAFTYCTPLYCHETGGDGALPGHSVEGTPSDCVKFAISHLLQHKPDMVVSGMNLGENSGISGFYSGTVAAAREGAFWQVLSVAFSIEEKAQEWLDGYSAEAKRLLRNLAEIRSNGDLDPTNRTFYNVNFPACPPSECRGVRVTRQSMAFFDDRYRLAPGIPEQNGYMIYGEKKDLETSDDFDSRALLNRYTTITPLDFDATAEPVLSRLTQLEPSLKKK